MRFLSLRLINYIGIYNGMGLNEIFIDFSKCRYNTVIIRGLNGSGKSTLYKALSVLPDPNDQFIPNMPAQKDVELLDYNTRYRISCIHGIKPNGERETTKVYFQKCMDGVNYVELNPSGNVTSYKDVLYEELMLDSNFIALSQLSSENKGLAAKKPAERKRFVNSIISSLETYNDIYKSLTKKSSMYKTMINSITTKLGQLGDPNIVESNLREYSSREAVLNQNRDQLLQSLGSLKSQVGSLDPDGSIQSSYEDAKQALAIYEKDREVISKSISSLMHKSDIDMMTDTVQGLIEIQKKKSDIQVDSQILKSSLTSILAERESESQQLLIKQQRLSTFENPDAYQDIADNIAAIDAENDDIKTKFLSIGIINIDQMSAGEFRLAINTIISIEEEVNLFKSSFDEGVISEALMHYEAGDKLPDIEALRHTRTIVMDKLKQTEFALEKVSDDRAKASIIDMRPASCNIDTCPFIQEAVSLSERDLEAEYKRAEKEYNDVVVELELIDNQITLNSTIAECMNRIRSIIRDIDVHSEIFMKLPNRFAYSSSLEYFKKLIIGGDHSREMAMFNSYLDMANLIDIYKNNLITRTRLEADYKLAMSQKEMVDELVAEIEAFSAKIRGLEDKVAEINRKLSDNDMLLIDLSKQESAYININELRDQEKEISDKILDATSKMSSLENSMKTIEIHLGNITTLSRQLTDLDTEIRNVGREKEKFSRAIDQIKEYQEELQKISSDYQVIETIRYYSSSTTGIQLVFMEMYMGKILSLANELLALLFEGKFVLQQFVINESEFRIPCMGSGILNDDISSMSSAELSMISMIISFALLYNSATKFNIIKLDEIDAALDANNRIMFLNVLNRIMEIMSVEQCIMISHNSELQTMYCDVILLRMSEDMENEYNTGNVIWRYN